MKEKSDYKTYYILIGESSSDMGINLLPEVRIIPTSEEVRIIPKSETDKWLKYHYDIGITPDYMLHLCKFKTEYKMLSIFKKFLNIIRPGSFKLTHIENTGDVYVGRFKSPEAALKYVMINHCYNILSYAEFLPSKNM